MNDRERRQLSQVIEYETALAQGALRGQMSVLFRRQAASGMLASGNTVVASLKTCGESAEALIGVLVERARPLHADLEAFTDIEGALAAFLQVCREQMQIALGHALGGTSPSDETAVWRMFGKMCAAMEAKLALSRFDFEEAGASSAPQAKPQKRGSGRLPAPFWDDLWAFMAAGLYDGSLLPKSQADVERIMSDWIAGEGHSAATSTIRLRAEKLWPLIAPDRK